MSRQLKTGDIIFYKLTNQYYILYGSSATTDNLICLNLVTLDKGYIDKDLVINGGGFWELL